MELKSFAVIPARGGSKGLPGKNVKILHGKPVISFTIEAALESNLFDEIIISSESEEILKISREYEVRALKRPLELASDSASTVDVIFHILEKISPECRPEIITLLQPTSPLRTSGDINAAMDMFHAEDCSSVVSVNEVSHSPYWSFAIKKTYLVPLFERKFFTMRRQDLPKIYTANGAIYISTPQMIVRNQGFYSDRTVPYIMPIERSIDIDTVIDFKLAEIIMGERYGISSSPDSSQL